MCLREHPLGALPSAALLDSDIFNMNIVSSYMLILGIKRELVIVKGTTKFE